MPKPTKKTPLHEMTTKQLREHRERLALIAEATAFETAYSNANSELDELGWPGLDGWVVGQSQAGALALSQGVCWGFTSQREHLAHISRCRELAHKNPFARNAVENLVSYICGSGFSYKASPRDKNSASDKALAEEVQAAMDEAVDEYRLGEIEQEAVRRGERDGEFILVAYEPDNESEAALRFREPNEMSTPLGNVSEAQGNIQFGVDIDSEDAAIIHGYYIGGKYLPADDVYHMKSNADSNVPRGISTLWTPRAALTAAMQSLECVTRTATIQSSIPYIRYHEATPGVVGAFVAGQADRTRTKANGQDVTTEYRKPGTVIDAPAKTKYEFPTTSVDVLKMTEAVQANLRAACSAMILPEWMMTGKLDGKYSNAEISEGPTGYMVNRKQASYTGRFREIMEGPILKAKGFTPEQLKRVKISVIAPGTGQGQTLEEAQVSQIQNQAGVLSKESWAAKEGLDYAQEQASIQREDDLALAGFGAPPVDQTAPQDQNPPQPNPAQ
ncbi:MAG: phage portal protein [Phycisphaeraceae bacterium]|nr:phage portal protein [Phycisphaeraceae bacterium]